MAGERKRNVTVRLSVKLMRQVRALAKKEMRPVGSQVELMLSEYLKTNKENT